MPSYIITGSNRGLGLEFVRQLSTSQNTILATIRSQSTELGDLHYIQKSSTAKIHILECDTSSPNSIKHFCTSLVPSALGSSSAKVDFLLSSAGQNSVPAQDALSIDPSDLAAEITTNVVGPAKLVEYLRPHLQRGSVVMNMTSGLASMRDSLGYKPPKHAVYSISKAALNMLTVHQAGALREKGIVVFCMDPGWVKTRMGGEEAVLSPEESIGGMLRVIHGVGEKDAGKFYLYDGREVAW